MACATLKRSLGWDANNQRPIKRRRCNPFNELDNSYSHDGHLTQSSNGAPMKEARASAFSEVTLSKISPEKMAQNLRGEINWLYKRKQLPFTANAMERMQDADWSGSEMGSESPLRSDSPQRLAQNQEKALFTFKQVQLICARMLKEREDTLREQYDAVLTTKLAEQYDTFVKFTFDQVQRRYEAAPSYLS